MESKQLADSQLQLQERCIGNDSDTCSCRHHSPVIMVQDSAHVRDSFTEIALKPAFTLNVIHKRGSLPLNTNRTLYCTACIAVTGLIRA